MSITSRRLVRVAAIAIGMGFAANATPVAAQEAIKRDGLIEEFVTIPVVIDTLFGKQTYKLKAYVARSEGDAPKPFAVVNHGKPQDDYAVRNMQVTGMSFHTREFARRGYFAVHFLRRG